MYSVKDISKLKNQKFTFCLVLVGGGNCQASEGLFHSSMVFSYPNGIQKSDGNQESETVFQSVLRKKCSENMQQIYRKTPMPKCDFNKVDLHGCSSVNLQHIFRIFSTQKKYFNKFT